MQLKLSVLNCKFAGVMSFFLLFVIPGVWAQTVTVRPSKSNYRIPSNLSMVLITQPFDVLAFEGIELYTNEGASRVKCYYLIRNKGRKSIRTIEIKVITNFLFRPVGGGRLEMYDDVVSFPSANVASNQGLSAGESIWAGNIERKVEMSLPQSLAAWIESQPSEMKAKFVVAIIPTRLRYQDGTEIDLDTHSDDLYKLFFDGVGTR